MASYVNFHSQLASIMEVLANAAVAEICQLVEDGFATLRLEISRSQRENLVLKSRLRLMEVCSGEPTSPPLLVTCTRKDHHLGEDGSAVTKRDVKSTVLENPDSQLSQLVVVTEQPVEPEVVVMKVERLEEELTDCRVLDDHQTAPRISIGPQSVSFAVENNNPLSVEAEIPRVCVTGRYENQDFVGPEVMQQDEKEEVEEARTQSHTSTLKASFPNRSREKTKEDVVDPSESSCSKLPDVESALIMTLESELSHPKTGGKGLCGGAEAVLPAVKLEAEATWPQASVAQNECLSKNRLTNTTSYHTELNTSSLDDSSFNDLFSSPEVARSLAAPHQHPTGAEEASSSFDFPSSFVNSSGSDSLTVSSRSLPSSDSRRTGRAFSCQHCDRVFSTSRDLMVHQRSHTGETIYHCHLCRKPFIHLHQLKTHQRVHTGEKPFSCAQCGKRFSQSSHIKRHMSVHTGEKRYSCSLCGKRFSQACSLKVHQSVHTGERPYSCTRCGKSFSVLGNLVRHQSVHMGK